MKPHRVQRKRTRGWRMPPNTKSVCRPTKWGNPVHIGKLDPSTGEVITREMAKELYRERMMRPESAALREECGRELRGFNLACYCPLDQPCHADVLLEIANSAEDRE